MHSRLYSTEWQSFIDGRPCQPRTDPVVREPRATTSGHPTAQPVLYACSCASLTATPFSRWGPAANSPQVQCACQRTPTGITETIPVPDVEELLTTEVASVMRAPMAVPALTTAAAAE